MEIKYTKVIELPKSQFPMYDYCDKHGAEGTDDWIFISDRYIQFRTPVQNNKGNDVRHILTLDRLDGKTVYSRPGEKATWSVEKLDNGNITLWPSINYRANYPTETQHFWFRNNVAILLNDSWPFKK